MKTARTSKQEMPVVILCGGLGTRLHEETERVPKPLLDIGGKPILWHIMKIYAHHGFGRFILPLGYKGWDIKEYFLRYREHTCDLTLRMNDEHKPTFHNKLGDENWEVTCAETGLTTKTGGRLWRVREYVDRDTFMFTYGDGIGAVDIDGLLDFHYQQGKIATVTGVHPSSRYGEMRVEGNVVAEFNEKPTIPEGFVSGGFFVAQREFFNYLNDDPELSFEHEPLQKLARDGQMAVFPHEGFWMGMDTYREYTQLNHLWDGGDAPWKVWDQDHPPQRTATYDPTPAT
jgi:glucose-1-phosphate cytidylyltransferase